MKQLKDYMLDPPDVIYPRCPVCGEECDTLYFNDGQIVGCENCIETRNAWDLLVDE